MLTAIPSIAGNNVHEYNALGKKTYEAGAFAAAEIFYSHAIAICLYDADIALYLTNRAAARLELQKFLHAERDCSRAIGLVPMGQIPKAHYRLWLDRSAQGKAKLAKARIGI